MSNKDRRTTDDYTGLKANIKLVVNTARLGSLLRNKNERNRIIVVDVRPFADYTLGHIPGAINVDLMHFHWIDTSNLGISQFNKQMQTLLSNLGLTKDKRVIFYESNSGPSAARGVWLLSYFLHRNVSLLDGGFEKWKKERYPIETKSNPYKHSAVGGKTNSKLLATYNEIFTAIKNKGDQVLLIDSRSNSEFDGSIIRASKAGHIPGAINIDWNRNIENGAFKVHEKLRKIYSNIPKHAKIITYCQGGYRAANSYIALKMLGYRNVKVYLGSWGEWGNKVGLPVKK
ncbi:MAG: sulfurtransferase [Nitrososphaeraceae archaeon]|jgi:thiosulfate/3-mercaptopyruvate sulfurtransferase